MLDAAILTTSKYYDAQPRDNVRTRRFAFLHLVIKEISDKLLTHKIRTRPGIALRVLVVHPQVQQGLRDDSDW
jgi:hypothetical protein